MTAGNLQNSNGSGVPARLTLHTAPPILRTHNTRQESWRVDRKLWKAYYEFDWCKNQVIEPFMDNGKSVLVRWLDEAGENKGWTCCVPLDPEAKWCIHPFRRLDRALAHIREHLDFKPYPCEGKCRNEEWYVRKFS